ncbi:AI-2E family transporter [Kitasatospora sp. NPDC101157]|uniref:AI-2E family transporter n=1 Tax=Kitasatospora sp. NPDC101157 TaxID=3364098 RepID=UPI0037F14453
MGRVARPEPGVPAGLRVSAGWAWRLLVLGVVAYAAFTLLDRFKPVVIAVFVGLVVAALLRPVADGLGKVLPRALAVAGAYLLALSAVAGVLTGLGVLVAHQAPQVAAQFYTGIARLERFLEGAPFHVRPGALTGLQHEIGSFVATHRASLVHSAVDGAAQVVEILTITALGLFCSVFFVHSGERMWAFVGHLLPGPRQADWERAGRAAWRALSGYIRGIVLVAATNAVLVGIALFVLRVPLAAPLAVLEFVAAFVPFVGSPVALAVAGAVALAARGPVIAVVVLSLIVVIGQLEGHLLHPMIMSWAVRLHPVVVAVSVIAGSIALGIIGAVLAVPAVSVVWAVVQALHPVDPRRAPRPDRAAGSGTPDRPSPARPARGEPAGEEEVTAERVG